MLPLTALSQVSSVWGARVGCLPGGVHQRSQRLMRQTERLSRVEMIIRGTGAETPPMRVARLTLLSPNILAVEHASGLSLEAVAIRAQH